MNIVVLLLFISMTMTAVGISLIGYVITQQTSMILGIQNTTYSTNKILKVVVSSGVASPQAAQMYKDQSVMLYRVLVILNKTHS